MYKVCIFYREITIHTVIYGVYIRFWPTLHMAERRRVRSGTRIVVPSKWKVCTTRPHSTDKGGRGAVDT